MNESLVEQFVKILLDENSENVKREARLALLNICHKVLSSPHDDSFRELYLDNDIFINKLLPAVGAIECLFEVGYVEDGERIYLPRSAPLLGLKILSKLLSNSTMPQNNTMQEAFFDRITKDFHTVMHYEDFNLQKKARNLIPINRLEIAVMLKIRTLQKQLKLENVKSAASSQFEQEQELVAKDLFLVELLDWFKNDFFKWINSPICSTCSIECIYERVVSSSDPHCSRIELHRCKQCNTIVEFPRYSHAEPLLTLRRGRCGEWANVFTLLCRSLGYDARFVYDETDHVWTEVWSIANKRWIHVDSCENKIDKPLMYEKGWKKKLTYIIAYSKDEVQDVTWRYTQDQEAVMKRRTICTEERLIQFLQSLNEQRQNSVDYSPIRKKYVVKRTLIELAEMLYVPNSQNEDSNTSYEGRTSGSLMWKLGRGEISEVGVLFNAEENPRNYIWDLSKYGKTFELQYNIVNDIYYVIHNDTILEQKSGWLEGMNTTEGGIFRKVENDWRMVYLARSPQAKYGCVKWSFEIKNFKLNLETFSLKAKSEIFNEANVSWEIEAIFIDDKTIIISVPNCNSFHTEEVREAVKLNVSVKLSGGKGELAWQHAQLFRQSLQKTEEPSMIINVQLKTREPLL